MCSGRACGAAQSSAGLRRRGQRPASFLDRTTYGRRQDPTLHVALARRFGSFYLVPEGGTDDDAVRAVSTLASEVGRRRSRRCGSRDRRHARWPRRRLCGTCRGDRGFGIEGAELDDRAIVVGRPKTMVIAHDHHFGGYARTSPELWDFIESFSGETGVRLDAVYTAKALIALRDRLRSSHPRPRAVLFVHTGGVPIDTNSALLEQGR